MKTNKFNFLAKNAINGNIKDSRVCYINFTKSERIDFWKYLNELFSIELIASIYFVIFGYRYNFSDIKFNDEDKRKLTEEINRKYNTDFQ